MPIRWQCVFFWRHPLLAGFQQQNFALPVLSRGEKVVFSAELRHICISRTIKEILVKVGDEVEEGQTLVTYDTSELEMQVKQAKLELEGIQNEIDSSNKKIATLTDELNKTTDEDDKFSLTTDIQSEENQRERYRQ